MSIAQHPSIAATGQQLTPGALVILYIIDLSAIGYNQQIAFTSMVDKQRGQAVKFGGRDYVPLDVKASGFDYDGQGALPQPKIEITNINRVMSTAAVLYHDLVGAKLIRIRTYEQFLDTGPLADASAMYPPDIYAFEQKTKQTKTSITWTLAAAMDQEGRKMPGRVVVRQVCPWRYRRFDTASQAFDYSRVKCPYTGDASFDRFGNPTTPDKDQPGRQVGNCCRVRFGTNNPLPFGGFPGVTGIRA